MNKRLYIFSLLIFLLIGNLFAADDWRIFGPGGTSHEVVSKFSTDSPPFLKWHKTSIFISW